MSRTQALSTLVLLLACGLPSARADESPDFDLAINLSQFSDSPTPERIVPQSPVPGASTHLLGGQPLSLSERPATLMQVSMTPDSTSETWVLVAPYVWATAQNGTIGARGRTVPIDLSLAELVDLIPDLNGAAMGHLEVGKGNAGLVFDALLMQIETSDRLPGGGRFSYETSSTILESLGMLRVVDVPNAEGPGSFVTVDLLGGARYYQVENDLRITPAGGATVQADMTKDWVDLVVGARTEVAITSELSGFLRADFGGFGIGTSSDLAWNLTTGAEYACSALPGSSLVLGYRILSIDETQKSGANRFVYDVTLHGPFTAIAFRF
ncbi:hypothetical protein Pan44_16120 [Caulifigura coniformis]|uniref:Outer membrane protein beta-barrel domain-containing protein n=1 Tax=Caulifigura coniformis TaxID=2527983 RepID=A0A517SBS6_9PLAN|nr:hypothetical protein [Caulifigura coniformis]QDT53590.1 hypothetical protein Pan44_16120 [Caulifigura coniformis]